MRETHRSEPKTSREQEPIDAHVICRQDDLVIRRMFDEDAQYELMVRWRNAPHVREWWDPDLPPLTLDAAKEEYRADTVPGSPSTACIVELGGEPAGFIQFYRWGAFPEDMRELGLSLDPGTWGIDQFIGEQGLLGRGLGTRMVRLLCDHLQDTGPDPVALLAEVGNDRAIRCYEKSGFERSAQVLDTDTRGGERVQSWLMIRHLSGGFVSRAPLIDR